MNELKEYFDDNSYDTDCIEMDVEDLDDSNIYSVFRSHAVIHIMTELIRLSKGILMTLRSPFTLQSLIFPFHSTVHRNEFSTGFIFNYWDCKTSPEKALWLKEEMTVKPIYNMLKDEIIEGGYLSVSQWNEFVVLKAQKYLKMERTKQVIGGRANAPSLVTTMQTADDSLITIDHLFAIILYCDFSILCTDFSATFRFDNIFEDLKSLKRRHSHFANFGRLLVESVLDFGINGDPDTVGHESGPFFSGLNCKLNIGSFAIRLKGPCSTSTLSEVAVNFARENGVILKMDNDGIHSRYQLFFDCSWISNFVEEQERLFVAGHFALRIVEITVVETAKNYRKELRTLYLFDAMITATPMWKSKVKESSSEYELLSKLIALELKNEMADSLEFDEFFKMEWSLFLQNKTEIKIKLCWLNKYFQTLWKLIMYDVVYNYGRRPNGNENVLKPEWLSMFPALREVVIITNGGQYQIGLEELLESVKILSPAVTINITQWESGESAVTPYIVNLYDAAGWNICYKSDNYGNGTVQIKHKE